jgi:hypothetical protein
MTGPFIVTTKREAVPLRADFPNALPNGPDHVERVAVATLEEAQNAAYSAAYQITKPERSFLPLAKVREAIPESGSAITLPDGTVIAVEPVPSEYPYDWIADECGIARVVASRMTHEQLRDAFNALEPMG